MKTSSILRILILASFFLTACQSDSTVPESHHPADNLTYRGPAVVERMIKAHGGMSPWLSSETTRFSHISFMPSMPDQFPRWMISHETTHQASRRAYADHPHWNSYIANNNEEVWSENWPFPNPPSQMIAIHYYMVFLPWLSQDDGTIFLEPTTGTLPGREEIYNVVTFHHPAPAGEKPDLWTFYIDRETNIMEGFSVDFAQGKAFHVIRGYTDADGLMVPSDWETFAGPQLQRIGIHAVVDASLQAPWDESRMQRPSTAQVDPSGTSK